MKIQLTPIKSPSSNSGMYQHYVNYKPINNFKTMFNIRLCSHLAFLVPLDTFQSYKEQL